MSEAITPARVRPTPIKPNHELIAKLAYQNWLDLGQLTTDKENWEQAEEQLWFNFVRAVDNWRG